MLKEEQSIGDYTVESFGFVQVSNAERQLMIEMIEEIYLLKKYRRLETLYLAVSLVDRYLAHQIVHGFEKPCLITLVVTCVLIAAKLE